MPRVAKELSAIEVKRLTCRVNPETGEPMESRHPVGGVSGLLLKVTPSGARQWILRTKVGKRRPDIGLGPFPEVSLAQARDKARELKEQIRAGADPVEEKRAAKRALVAAQLSTMSFEQAMEQYIDMKAKEFRNPRQAQQWRNSLKTYAVPRIGATPVREIELAHIKAVLDPIWESKTETANRVRARLENILGWCAIHGYRSNDNPARWQGYLDEVYPSPEKIKKKGHHKAMPLSQLSEFMQQLSARKGTAAKALEFLILTAARTNEVIGDKRIGKRGIVWGDVDLVARIWTIPAELMKSEKVHRVPLCSRAVEILEAIGPGEGTEPVFPGPKGQIPSNNFLSAVMKRMDAPYTVHGFRSTFKDWARENTAYADEVSELALAHVNDDATRAAYARSELIEKRRLMMGDWERFCYERQPLADTDKIVPIGGGSP
ncbi:integrase [Tamilnaduibacter salinus]|uniref:Integrase n=1 Tax=Tamilnaduibacter salinus TaxID=1484056 RepID=A0A2U1CZV2_9GAMM|nr:site-specific integrase [Tamilnaduibacter salinus]PVY78194.1 integrase [Tamilnaduibacter salinus]